MTISVNNVEYVKKEQPTAPQGKVADIGMMEMRLNILEAARLEERINAATIKERLDNLFDEQGRFKEEQREFLGILGRLTMELTGFVNAVFVSGY